MSKEFGKYLKDLSKRMEKTLEEFSDGFEDKTIKTKISTGFIDEKILREEMISDLIKFKNYTKINATRYTDNNIDEIINILMEEYTNTIGEIK